MPGREKKVFESDLVEKDFSHKRVGRGYEVKLTEWCAWGLSSLSPVRLFATLCTASCQAPLSMGFSRKEHWSGLPCPPARDLTDPETEPSSLTSLALAGGFFTTSATLEWSEVISDSLWLNGLYSPWHSPGQNTGVGSHFLLNPGIKPRSPALQVNSLPAEPQGNPKLP